MPKILNFRFLEGGYFLYFDNAELKRSPKIKFSVSALLGGSGLKFTNPDTSYFLRWQTYHREHLTLVNQIETNTYVNLTYKLVYS